MGVTAMIPNMTFQQLKDEANERWERYGTQALPACKFY